VPVDPRGLTGPTRHQAALAGRPEGEWRRTSRGFYVPTYVDRDLPEQRVLEASVLLPPNGAVTGWGALRLLGGRFFDGSSRDGELLPVDLVAGPHSARRRRPGVHWSQDRLEPAEVRLRHGVRITAADRAAFDAARLSPDVRAATVVLDMAFAAELTGPRRFAAYVEAHPGWNGSPQARAAHELSSEDSRSPKETDLRLVWELDAGLPRPLVNVEVFSRAGKLLGVADLLDPASGLVVEFDGADHAGSRRRSEDAGREARLRAHLLEVERVTGYDLHHVPALVSRLHAARRRARWLPEHARRWTVTPPPGWKVGLSLDDRLDLRDWQREVDESA
jgi:hypothetical protein